METHQDYGFFLECESVGNNQRSARGADLPWLDIPAAMRSRLDFSIADVPCVRPVGVDAHSSATRDQADSVSIVFEILRQGFQTHLAMMVPPAADVRVNGLHVGPVAILRVKDQVQVNSDCVFHVSVRHRPFVGFAELEEIGLECLICRTRITAEQTLFRCTNCGAALHCGAPDRAECDRLECALASNDCPRCRRRLVREEECEYVPDV